jgi:hypothetical protein
MLQKRLKILTEHIRAPTTAVYGVGHVDGCVDTMLSTHTASILVVVLICMGCMICRIIYLLVY